MLTVTNVSRPITSFNPVISADGKFVAFKSFGAASLLLRHDLENGSTDLVSRNASGDAVLSDPNGPDMTPDGRFIAYTEAAAPIVGYSAVYLWEAQTGARTLVSANLSGQVTTNTFSDTPAVSADGRFVAFLSDAPDLITNAVGDSFQVYLRDVTASVTRLVSADVDGEVSGETGGAIPTISADGRYIAFDSFDGNYVANDNNNAIDVFVRDMASDSTELISRAVTTVQSSTADGLSSISANSVSANGRFIAFVSLADNLTANDTNGFQDVFVRDLQNGTNLLVSINGAGTGSANGFSGSPVIRADGRYVASAGVSPPHLFVWDSQAGANVYSTPTVAMWFYFVLSPDGRTLVFQSATNIDHPIIAHDLVTGADRVIGYGAIAGGPKAQISDNGRFVAFVSAANSPTTPPGVANVFLYDLQTETTTLVSFNRDRSG